MLAINVEFVGGVAHLDTGAYRTRGSVEWPPHPDRFFMALVAAAFRGVDPSSEEIKALKWLESQPAPCISASEALRRPTIKSYVPTNDRLVAARNKEKLLSSCVPDDPTLTYLWQSDLPDNLKSGLESILGRVTYLGRSESIVSCEIGSTSEFETGWVPDENGTTHLRVSYAGRFENLRADFDAGLRPTPGAWASYRYTGDVRAKTGEWSDIFPMQLNKAVGLEKFLSLNEASRKAVMGICDDPLPDWLSGHEVDGSPALLSHVAFMPLADVGSRFSTGNVLGVGLAIPSRISPEQVGITLKPLLSSVAFLGNQYQLEPVSRPRRALMPPTWTDESRVWTTVTPVTLSRWPKKRHSVEDLVRLAIDHSQLPQPQRIILSGASKLRGGLGKHLSDYPPRYRVHATFEWEEPVAGPIIVGANRYQGLGLCKAI